MGIKKRMKNYFKTRCCLFKLDRLARAKTWSLERPDTRKTRSSEEKLARTKNSMLQVCNPEAGSSDRVLARAKNSKTYTSLARAKKARSSQETQLSGLKPRRSLSLERPNPGSSEGPKTTARSSDQLLARAKAQKSRQQHLVSNPTNL